MRILTSSAAKSLRNFIDREAFYRLAEVLLKRGANANARTREFPPQRSWVTRLGSLAWVDFTGQTPFLRAALAGDVGEQPLADAHLVGAAGELDGNHRHAAIAFRIRLTASPCGPASLITLIGASA